MRIGIDNTPLNPRNLTVPTEPPDDGDDTCGCCRGEGEFRGGIICDECGGSGINPEFAEEEEPCRT